MLATFDAPNGDFSCVRRLRSNTPLQALTTLNETVFVECARALARQVLEDGGRTDAERITYAFRRVLGRTPTVEERTVLLDLLEAQMQTDRRGPGEPARAGHRHATHGPTCPRASRRPNWRPIPSFPGCC